MNARRRRIKERVQRVETLKSQSAEFSAFFKRVQNAINAAVARGETESSDRFIQEAFGMRPNESSGDPK